MGHERALAAIAESQLLPPHPHRWGGLSFAKAADTMLACLACLLAREIEFWHLTPRWNCKQFTKTFGGPRLGALGPSSVRRKQPASKHSKTSMPQSRRPTKVVKASAN